MKQFYQQYPASRNGIDAILDYKGNVVESSLDHLKEQITACLERNGVEVVDMEGLSDVLQQPSIFTKAKQPLINEYQQVISHLMACMNVFNLRTKCTTVQRPHY